MTGATPTHLRTSARQAVLTGTQARGSYSPTVTACKQGGAHRPKTSVPLASHYTGRSCGPSSIPPSFILEGQFHDSRSHIAQRFVPPISSADLSLSHNPCTSGGSLDILTSVSRQIKSSVKAREMAARDRDLTFVQRFQSRKSLMPATGE